MLHPTLGPLFLVLATLLSRHLSAYALSGRQQVMGPCNTHLGWSSGLLPLTLTTPGCCRCVRCKPTDRRSLSLFLFLSISPLYPLIVFQTNTTLNKKGNFLKDIDKGTSAELNVWVLSHDSLHIETRVAHPLCRNRCVWFLTEPRSMAAAPQVCFRGEVTKCSGQACHLRLQDSFFFSSQQAAYIPPVLVYSIAILCLLSLWLFGFCCVHSREACGSVYPERLCFQFRGLPPLSLIIALGSVPWQEMRDLFYLAWTTLFLPDYWCYFTLNNMTLCSQSAQGQSLRVIDTFKRGEE